MIERDFFVGGTVGAGQSRKPDVIRLRKALRKTGHSRPSSQPSGAYDRSLHDAVVRFQRDFGLEEDGIVGPGGPTQTAINIAHAAMKEGGRDGYEAIRAPYASLHRAGLRYEPAKKGAETDGRWVTAGGRVASSSALRQALKPKPGESSNAQIASFVERDPVTGQRKFPGERTGRGLLEGGGGGGGVPRGNLPAGDLFKSLFRNLFEQSDRKSGNDEKKATPPGSAPMDGPPANLPRQVPPFPAEPPPDPEKGKEQIKAEEPRLSVLPGPKPEEVRPGIFIFPDQSEEFNKPNIVESDRRGNQETRADLEKLRDWFLTPERIDEGWEHFAGGRLQGTGEEKKERSIPNPLKDFQREKIPGRVDGRKGSKFPDLSFYNNRTKKWVFIQLADVDKNGKVTQREQDNAWSIRQRTGGQVFVFGKRTTK